MKKITEIAHQLANEGKHDVAVDFTCGNGYDTQYLSEHFTCVYAFDIQEEAIVQAKKRCLNDNVSFHLCSHEKANEYVSSFDFGIFNLGYLPKGDQSITTQPDTVIQALENVLPLLTKLGRLVMVLYPGFQQGEVEAKQVEAYISKLPSKEYDCLKIQPFNKQSSPYILLIEKH